MNYEKMWKALKASITIHILINTSGAIELDDGGFLEPLRTVLKIMENYEKLMKEEESTEEDK